MVWVIPFCSPVAELNRWLDTQKLSGIDRSAQTSQVNINSHTDTCINHRIELAVGDMTMSGWKPTISLIHPPTHTDCFYSHALQKNILVTSRTPHRENPSQLSLHQVCSGSSSDILNNNSESKCIFALTFVFIFSLNPLFLFHILYAVLVLIRLITFSVIAEL